jgi:hypothetical protein
VKFHGFSDTYGFSKLDFSYPPSNAPARRSSSARAGQAAFFLNTGCCALFVQLSESRHIRNPERRDVLPSGITVFAFAEIDVRARTAPVADLAGETDIKCTNLSEIGFGIKLRSNPANY